ncbi:uncharacterized protein LOC103931124 isoform X2 [Pyrus x bretschneideri]|uniref:uncharacterized protein LOC103931124 isoform X2 n=2 Tax=Pyrus TaxID=3766 RepID=UPI00202E8C18|nr:uncharacterized protein LOC103931124 isoform X2 [Pyrus x bretschneideri]
MSIIGHGPAATCALPQLLLMCTSAAHIHSVSSSSTRSLCVLLLLLKLLCLFGIKTAFIVIHAWMELVRAAVCFQVNIFLRIMIWTLALISLPGRVLTTLQRERQLEKHLLDMQIEVENLALDRKELQEHLHTAINERRMMELILAELEGEHDKAIAKVELLVSELHDLRTENLRLKEIQG